MTVQRVHHRDMREHRIAAMVTRPISGTNASADKSAAERDSQFAAIWHQYRVGRIVAGADASDR
jgi:hypothetical protein